MSSFVVPDLCLATMKRRPLWRGARRSNPRESGCGIRPRRTPTELTLQLPDLEQAGSESSTSQDTLLRDLWNTKHLGAWPNLRVAPGPLDLE